MPLDFISGRAAGRWLGECPGKSGEDDAEENPGEPTQGSEISFR